MEAKEVIVMDHPLIQHKISMLREKDRGTNEFRKLVEEIATMMGYEALRDLPLENRPIETPIEHCETPFVAGKKLALVPVLRAGLGMVSGLLTLVPTAKVGHVGLYRDPETHEPHEYYCKLPESIEDRLVMVLALLGTTIPTFVFAAVLQYVFTVSIPLFPTTGWGTWGHLVLPVACMCVGPLASYARYMRSSVLDITNQDFILTAEAKGVSSFRIVSRHIFRNSFLPCITMICTSIAGIFSGSFIIESIFAIPGLGKYFISAINDRDYSVVLGLNIIFTGIYILSILVCDILLAIIDPRIRIAEEN